MLLLSCCLFPGFVTRLQLMRDDWQLLRRGELAVVQRLRAVGGKKLRAGD